MIEMNLIINLKVKPINFVVNRLRNKISKTFLYIYTFQKHKNNIAELLLKVMKDSCENVN